MHNLISFLRRGEEGLGPRSAGAGARNPGGKGPALAACLLLAAWGGGPVPALQDGLWDPCAREGGDDEELGPSADLYCMSLVPSPGLGEVSGAAWLRRVPGPFGTAVTAAGHQVYDLVFTLEGLPEPSSLGPYTTYVAWVTTPLHHPVEKLGPVGNGRHEPGRVSFDKFLVLVSAEPSADVEERTGRLVLRGQSPSTRMAPPDLLEFLLGAAPLEEEDAGDGHGAHMGPEPRWSHPPMPEGLTMLPALMRLGPPEVAPYLPAPGPSDPVVEARPRELVRLVDGDSLRLEAVYVRRSVGGRSLVMYGFNGQYPGPLLHVPAEATITVDFRNRIDWPATVHWHGVRLENRFDGVPHLTQEPVPPGGSFRYRVRFPDAGIYWYHPHHREDVLQGLGLYGNILVRSPRADYFGPAHREEVLMLDDLLIGEAGLVPFGAEGATHTLMGRFGNVLLVNGEPEYELRVRRGEVVRFFLTNVANTRTFNLSFGGAPMKLVASDVGNFRREERVESVVLAPAERYVAHVRFPEAGTYALVNRVRGIDHLAGRFFPEVDTLGLVDVSDEPAEPDLDAAFHELREDREAAAEIDRYRAHFDRPVDRRLVLEMETRDLPLVVDRLMRLDSAYFHPVEWSGTMPEMNWISTGANVRWILRDPDTGRENAEIDWRFRAGEVMKIRISNRREVLHAMQHPIHIHGQRFLVLAQDGVPNENPVWKDTVLIPVGSTVDLLLDASNPGAWMLHCHIAEHLDAGMQMVFTVD